MPKPTAAAPVNALTLFTSAAPVEEAFAAAEDVGLEEETAGDVGVGTGGVLVSVTPTLLQMACEYASAFARSAPEHACMMQTVVLLTKGTLAQRQALSE